MKKTTSGFTLIELIVVIIVIGILSTIGIFSFSGVQVKTRDTQRSSKAVIITESLEKYYDNNGAYPDCNSLKATDVTTNVLRGITKETLVTPKSTNRDNAITCGEVPLSSSNDVFAYIYDNASGSFSFKYLEEATGNIITINNRRSTITSFRLTTTKGENIETIDPSSGRWNTGKPVKITATALSPYFSFDKWQDCSTATSSTIYLVMDSNKNCIATAKSIPEELPSPPTVTISESGPDIIATITPVSCKTGVTEYSIRHKENDAASWSGYTTPFSANTVYTQTSNQGYKYEYQAKSRCHSYDNDKYSIEVEGPVSLPYFTIINQPIMPAVSASTTGNDTTWIWGDASCPIGTTLKYYYTYNYQGYNGTDKNQTEISKTDTTKYPIIRSTTISNTRYTVTAWVKCTNSYKSSPDSLAKTAIYDRPSLPTTPTVSITEITNGTIIQATISTVTCASGTAQYQIKSRVNEGAWSGYSAFGTTKVFTQPASQGYKYEYQAKSQCWSSATNTASGLVESTVSSYIKQIDKPTMTAVTAANNGVNTSNGNKTTWTWTSATCPTTTTAKYFYSYWYKGYAGSDSSWTFINTATTSEYPIIRDTYNEGYDYKVTALVQCYNNFDSSDFSESKSASYPRPITAPTAPSSWTIERKDGAAIPQTYWTATQISNNTPPKTVIILKGTSSCGPGASLYSQTDIASWGWGWVFSPARANSFGWYKWWRLVNGTSWAYDNPPNPMRWLNTWKNRTNTISQATISNNNTVPSGKEFQLALQLKCVNEITGVESAASVRYEGTKKAAP